MYALGPFRALVGGNCNNGLHVGALALNVNNALSNANWNIGAAFILFIRSINLKPFLFLHPWALKYALTAIIGRVSDKLT